jgi:hypothetical protein
VGRSPENFFDHLSGLLIDSSWSQRVQLLQFSWRWVDEEMNLACLFSHLQ